MKSKREYKGYKIHAYKCKSGDWCSYIFEPNTVTAIDSVHRHGKRHSITCAMIVIDGMIEDNNYRYTPKNG